MPRDRAVKAATQMLQDATLKPTAAARAWCVDRELVNYWFKKMQTTGVTSLPIVVEEPVVRVVVNSTAPDAPDVPEDHWERYCAACIYAGKLCDKMGKRKAAAKASSHFNVQLSASTARRASQAGGMPPKKPGREPAVLPADIERKLEDLVLCLRELHLPVFKFMVINYVNTMIAGTDLAA
eukprot:6196611-Pleurochrysis_carterae.AAC.1